MLQPKINIIEKMQSSGLNQGWIDTSFNIVKQMQIMLGKISDDKVMTDASTGTRIIDHVSMANKFCKV